MLQNNHLYQQQLDIVCHNLSARNCSINNNSIVRKAYLKELATVIVSTIAFHDGIVDEIRSIYKDLLTDKLELSKTEKHLICSFLADELIKLSPDPLSMFIHDVSIKPQRLCYVKNHYSDIAYRIFDNALNGVTSEYADSFDLAAQSVFYENCSGCILPYESEGGGIMVGIKAIAEKYELNKSLVCHVDAGGQMTKFVLFTRGVWVDDTADRLEFSVRTPSFFDCSDIIEAGGHFGFSNGHVNSTSFVDDDQRYSSFCFNGNMHSMVTMLLYLSLEYERSYIYGIYNEIANKQH